ncbi:uncharacterized protein RMCC_2896 [Mycolicibacterium canariasense]|uniref:Uncharacterized protein n=1 Tax=Mycolicibacterium canariasense TaxID=228230 RepID=A0A124E276_MYCCR|nr:hypothetical protein [Mycolicibacterium canariasense]ORU97020.1 hypothetical protein AWB94_30175 [Mycolicibacterium canariasense]GAS95930.1 uncharacterized protein RMCC_2896 [Mycolicibacterium canariasense]
MAIDVAAKVLLALAGGVTALALAAPASADPTDAPPPPVPPVAADPAAAAAPPDGVPHLSSPDAPPPGSTMDPSVMAGAESPRVSYLRDLWNAVQNREISGKEALVLGLAQRGMDTPDPVQAPPAVPAPPPGVPAPPAPPAIP